MRLRFSEQIENQGEHGKSHRKEGDSSFAMEIAVDNPHIDVDREEGEGHDPQAVLEDGDENGKDGKKDPILMAFQEKVTVKKAEDEKGQA